MDKRLDAPAPDQRHGLDALLRPASIALVGASTNPQKIGGIPLRYLVDNGYRGKLFPVNPSADIVQALPAWPTISSIGEPVDLAIIAVPAAQAMAAVEEAARSGARSAILFTSGFAETGTVGQQLQADLAKLVSGMGMRLLGPNCLGVINVRDRVYATFSRGPDSGAIAEGSVAIVSQSGAFAAHAYSMLRERGVGLSHWMTTGNQADVDLSDCLDWLADDDRTDVLLVYMEGCADGQKLRRVLQRCAAAGKSVVVTKVGRSDAGARAAASHTAALTGDDAVYDALFKQAGAIRAGTIDQFLDLGVGLAAAGKRPASRRVGVLTVSGGVGALMADDTQELGLELPVMDADRQARLLGRVPLACAGNPLDITAQVGTELGLLGFSADLMGGSAQYDSLVMFLASAGLAASNWPGYLDGIRTFREKYPDILCVVSGMLSGQAQRELLSIGCVPIRDPSAAIGVIAKLIAPDPPDTSTAAPLDPPRLPAAPLHEAEALGVLASAGIPVVRHEVCRTAAQATEAARALGYPVAVKVLARNLPHKSDAGGVELSLTAPREVEAAFDAVTEGVRRRCPDAVIEGALVAPMVRGGVECILGSHHDPVFGPVVMLGIGGVFVEVVRDVTFRLAPFGIATAYRMIEELKGKAVLFGARGGSRADIDALANALVRLGDLACAASKDVESIDVNPFVVLPAGQGAVALDAVVVVRGPAEAAAAG